MSAEFRYVKYLIKWSVETVKIGDLASVPCEFEGVDDFVVVTEWS